MVVRKTIQKFIGKVKENYKYYKLGRQEEEREIRRTRVESNIRNMREWHPDAADRMEEDYNKLKKKGVY